ncbi:MAG: class I tRNA ligase family protein [Arhodomonas sp.]|nr:class I tRNA ligase family protein [Arhodomonas sp.]
MSKSRGNVVAPQEVMNKLGADILRLWVGSTDYSGEIAVSDEILKRTADSLPAHAQYRALPARPTWHGFEPAARLRRPRAACCRWTAGPWTARCRCSRTVIARL